MLEVGSVSKKNMKNILVKNFFDACVGAIMWWATGYALSSGNDTFRTSGNNGFAGTSAFFLDGNVGRSRILNGPRGACLAARTHSQKRPGTICRWLAPPSAPARRRRRRGTPK